MGMFDELHIAYPMPEGYEHLQDVIFQTKDLDCYLYEYHITKTGQLLKRTWDTEVIPPEERVKSILNMVHTTRRADTYTDVQVFYHGDILTYPSIPGGLENFIIRFTHGTVEWMKHWSGNPDDLVTRYELKNEEEKEAKTNPPEAD